MDAVKGGCLVALKLHVHRIRLSYRSNVSMFVVCVTRGQSFIRLIRSSVYFRERPFT